MPSSSSCFSIHGSIHISSHQPSPRTEYSIFSLVIHTFFFFHFNYFPCQLIIHALYGIFYHPHLYSIHPPVSIHTHTHPYLPILNHPPSSLDLSEVTFCILSNYSLSVLPLTYSTTSTTNSSLPVDAHHFPSLEFLGPVRKMLSGLGSTWDIYAIRRTHWRG